jgi:hypothetical protein
MKRAFALLGSALLSAGMIYAMITIAALPANARRTSECTTSECATFEEYASNICEDDFHCDGGGRLISCDGETEAIFECYNCGVHILECP